MIQKLKTFINAPMTERAIIALLNRNVINYRKTGQFFFTEESKKRVLIVGIDHEAARIARLIRSELNYPAEIVGTVRVDENREEMREEMIIDQLRQRDVAARIAISPRELEDYLELQAGRAYFNQEFKLSHILVSVSREATPEQIDAALSDF